MARHAPATVGQGIAVIATVYALLALVLWPAYNWPVVDSWAFGYTVKQWLEQGRFVFVDWGAMSLFAHAAWGALFSLPAGFSFGAVNLSTFVLSWVAATATYLALRELEPDGESGIAAALAGAGVLIVNPAVVLLSYSYMTDIPFLAWYTLSAWCDLRGLRRRDSRWLLLGSVFAMLAVLIRQNGIVLPAALGAYLLWQWLRKRRAFPWREGLAGAALPALALAVLTALSRLGALPGRTDALQWVSLSLSPALLANLFRMLLYVGLFLLPLTLAVAAGAMRAGGWRNLRQWVWLVALTALAGAGAVIQYLRPFKLPYLGTWRMMPYYPAVWSVFGTGSQGEWLAGTREMLFGYRFWIVITALSCAGAGLLVWTLLHQARQGRGGPGDDGWPTGFVVLMAAGYLLPLLLFKGEIYERYLIGLILPAAALALRAARSQRIRLSLPAFAVPALVFLGFSLALTAEFIAWNGAAWNAASRLAGRGVSLEQIDGGFCWNGWHFAGQIGKTDAVPEPGAPAYMELTPQITRKYVVSFSPLAGYETLATEPYWSPLRWRKAALLILQRR